MMSMALALSLVLMIRLMTQQQLQPRTKLIGEQVKQRTKFTVKKKRATH
jgi:hypothetical protein